MMHDMEKYKKGLKIIKGLENCRYWSCAGLYEGYAPNLDMCAKCPYFKDEVSAEDCHNELINDTFELMRKDQKNWAEIRNTIRELRNNNPDKPQVQEAMTFLLELMKVIWEK